MKAFLSLLLLFSTIAPLSSQAKNSIAPPDDPQQNISYWKPFVISPQGNTRVRQAHRIFQRLLRGWDSSRVEPALSVVKSSAGPWAASLLDGNILLSQKALEISQQIGGKDAEHLIAFILSHELAHQRADDLWHYKFFRLIGNQAKNHRRFIEQLKSHEAEDLERREAQADHDGLVLMATTGFNPYVVIEDNDFFTAWVEHIWNNNCNSAENNTACEQAQQRKQRALAQLKDVVTRTSLYELGVHAYVAADYKKARQYFKAFGRTYPSSNVYNSLGLTYLSQILQIDERRQQLGDLNTPTLYFPLILDAHPGNPGTTKPHRGSHTKELQQLQQRRKQYLQQAIAYFEKSTRINPANKQAYLHLVACHLLDNNTPMAQGILLGKYKRQFDDETTLNLYKVLLDVSDKQYKEAETGFDLLRQSIVNNPDKASIPDIDLYVIYKNATQLLEYQGNTTGANNCWHELAKIAKHRKDPSLFQVVLKEIKKDRYFLSSAKQTVINHFKSNNKQETQVNNKSTNTYTIWFEGDKLNVYNLANGNRLVMDNHNKIISAKVSSPTEQLTPSIKIGSPGDVSYKQLGSPSRTVNMGGGQYLAYDQYGIALYNQAGIISGWIYY